MTSLFISVLLAAMCLECRAQKDDVLQPKGDVTAAEGEAVTLGCQYNSSVTNNYLFWYKQEGNNSPKFILSRVKLDEGNTPDEFKERFSSTLDSNLRSVPLQIQKLQLSDSAVYYCRLNEFVSLWWTFGGGTRLDVGSDVRPTLTVLPPSSEELQQGKATLICLANKGFPSDWSLAWKVDGSSSSSSSSSGEESRSPGVLQKDGRYSWSSTLRLPADQWRKVGSVTCEATQGSQTPVSETLRRDQCSQS
ncbi:immunoglobulin lambda-1 light chain-like [Thunnus albacares]|uniref:immunoglobulin lambda-1 light chain-like n=1 Tax=Thunnus albacares TaxID=8236 RepID=UPI001CF7156F|nr:immunoglobulin lambda-1 light chain-like [Thunnus albacares]